MKQICIACLLLILTHICISQVSYYKGEWRVANTTDLFACVCKLQMEKDNMVTAEFVWIYKATDSTHENMMDLYKGKKGKVGIEFTKGTYNPVTCDIYLEAIKLIDPDEILGMAKYFLKMSADKQTIYGNSMGIGVDEPGLFCAVKMSSSGSRKFIALKNRVKQ